MTQQTMRTAACGSLLLASLALPAATVQAQTVPCSGPLAHCAIEVGATCEMVNGKQHIMFYDKGGYSAAWERCVGKEYEARGMRNPYTGAQPQKPAPKR